MITLLWVLSGLYGIDVIARICWLASGNIPKRTPGVVAVDAVTNLGILIWIIVLLA